jgi:hypothetical protein
VGVCELLVVLSLKLCVPLSCVTLRAVCYCYVAVVCGVQPMQTWALSAVNPLLLHLG